jgi:hypothetical protein
VSKLNLKSSQINFQDVEKEVIAAVLGQGLLESDRLVHLMDDCKIRPETPPKITSQVWFVLFLRCCRICLC